MEAMLYYLLFSVGVNLLLFGVAYLFQTDKITDISYSLTFMVLAAMSYFGSEMDNIDFILFLLVVVWGVRLGTYLLYRIHRIGRDQRFDSIRNNVRSFFFFWLMQGLTCFIVLIPVFIIHRTEDKESSILFLVGIIVAIIGLLIETIADAQKFRFKLKQPNVFMKNGLWSIVQHPNYSGELLFWWGIWFSSFMILPWYAVIGPLWISLIIIKFSGIPILQRQWKARYGESRSFEEYNKRTYKLLPFVY